MEHRLQIFSLGSPKIFLDECDITLNFETNAARGLFIYLCVNRDIIHSRTALANLLWPDLSPARSLKTFSQTLNRVRYALEDRDTKNSIILIHGHKNIQINPDCKYWLDSTEFTQYVTACENHRHRHFKSCPICLEWLQHAADLYQTDFLPGFELPSELYQAWVRQKSAILHHQAMDLLYMLTHSYEYLEDYKNAQIFARRQLILEPWNEEAHCQLMQNYALEGKRSAAIDQYRECCQVLQKEFNVKPSTTTNQLYNDICNEVLTTQSKSSSIIYKLPAPLGTFIGRNKELNQLLHLLLDPTNRLVTITGLAGVGKTQLAIASAKRVIKSFANGVIFIDLLQILSGGMETLTTDFLVSAIAHLFYEDKTWHPFCSDHISLMQALLDCLVDKDILLVLDNFEQHPALTDFVWQIINGTTNIAILITSHCPANIYGEKVFPLHGLTYPVDELSDSIPTYTPKTLLTKYESVQLFIQRAREYGCDLALDEQNTRAIVEICQQVNGSPLALEMAASEINSCPVYEIAHQIRTNLDSLQTTFVGVAQRHFSMKAILLKAWLELNQNERATLLQLVSNLPNTISSLGPEQVDSLEKLTLHALIYQDKQGVYKIPHLVRQFIVTYPVTGPHRII